MWNNNLKVSKYLINTFNITKNDDNINIIFIVVNGHFEVLKYLVNTFNA